MRDPDRCLAGHDFSRDCRPIVVQCQGSVHHDGLHFFGEDHYVFRWDDAVEHAQSR